MFKLGKWTKGTLFVGLALGVALIASVYQGGWGPGASAAATKPDLGLADNFAVFAAAGITNVGATVITGDLGTDPTPAVTGFFGTTENDGPGVVSAPGTIHQADATSLAARGALNAAYLSAAGQVPDFTVDTELGGQILAPGVYNSADGTFGITAAAGILTLNGNANAVWVFETTSTLITSASSTVTLTGGAQACNVFWQVGSSATLGATSTFRGTIMADTTISVGASVTVDGRLLAGAVTDSGTLTFAGLGSTVTKPTCVVAVPPTLTKGFLPFGITAGGDSVLTIVLLNPNVTAATLSAVLIDTLPDDVVIDTTPNAGTTCDGIGDVVATAGGTTVTLPVTRTIPGGAPGTCTVTVDVTASAKGVYVNTLPIGALQTSNGDNAAAVSATLTVAPKPSSGGGGGGGTISPSPTPTAIPSFVFLSSAFCLVDVCPYGQQYLQAGQQMYATFSLNRVPTNPTDIVRAEAYWNGAKYTSISWPGPYTSAGPFSSATILSIAPDAGIVELRVWVGATYVGAFNTTVVNPFVEGTCPGIGTNCPQIVEPLSGVKLSTLGTTLLWWNPPGTAQVHVRVTPANNDGPGINLILGSPITSFTVPEPIFGEGNYIILPGMTYTWQARVTSQTTSAKETDGVWGPWSDPQTFQTRTASSNGISLVSPKDGGSVDTLTPILRWSNSDKGAFYYEVQLSTDPGFNTNPATAIASVYWNLVHGVVSSPENSWMVPSGFALKAGTTYHWRVRPRIQGDGVPVSWSRISSFRTAIVFTSKA